MTREKKKEAVNLDMNQLVLQHFSPLQICSLVVMFSQNCYNRLSQFKHVTFSDYFLCFIKQFKQL